MGSQSRMLTPPEGAKCVYPRDDIDRFANQIAEHIRSQTDMSDPTKVKILGVTPEGFQLAAKVVPLLGDVLVTDDQCDGITFRNRQLPGTHSHAIDPRGTSLPSVDGKDVYLLLARERSGFSRRHLADLAKAAGAASVHTAVMIHQPTNGNSRPDFVAETIEDPDIRLFGFGIPLLDRPPGIANDYATLPEIYILPRF